MNEPTKCNQSGCRERATHRFTWPGRAPAGICSRHVGLLQATAEALGLKSVDLQPLIEQDPADAATETARAMLVVFLLDLVESVRTAKHPTQITRLLVWRLRRAADELHARFE